MPDRPSEVTTADRERASEWTTEYEALDVLAAIFAAHRLAAERAERERCVKRLRERAAAIDAIGLPSSLDAANELYLQADLLEREGGAT